jgi:hypothetical protein
MALIAFPGVPAINYKGYYAYHGLEECEAQRIPLENFMADVETGRGNDTFYIQTYCLEMQAFEDQLKKYKEEKGISLGAENLGA